jgi:predicted ferric reductase
VFAHPLVLFIVEPHYLEYLDPRVNAPRAVFLVAAMIGLVLLTVLPLVREKIALKYEWWHLSHAVFAAGVLVVGLTHGLQVGHYISGVGKQAVWVAVALAGLAPIAYVRLVRPWRLRQRPYRVADVREERGETTTLVLKPEGHDGLHFTAGQFAWLRLGPSPWSLRQHHFSLSSSALEPGKVELTIRALGDFTGKVHDVPPGTRAFLDGPHGAFALRAQPVEGAVFVMGGIGITPAMSILRTCRDRGDRRRMVLIYANTSWDEVAFREELEALESELDLKVVHVLEEPPDDWPGETGLVTDEVLDRHLPRDGRDAHYFVCGPPPLMEGVEKYLARRGVPIWNRSVERFDFA